MSFFSETSHIFFPDTFVDANFQTRSEPVNSCPKSVSIDPQVLRQSFMLIYFSLFFMLKIVNDKLALLGRQSSETAVQTIEIQIRHIVMIFLDQILGQRLGFGFS